MSNAACIWFGELYALLCPCSFNKAVMLDPILVHVKLKCVTTLNSALQHVCSKEYLALLACPHLVPL